MAPAGWKEAWTKHVADIRSDVPPAESAARLRRLVRSKLLMFTDVKDDPAKFFEAHRILVDPKTRGPGFWIRFTVQYNLFAGTVLGLGGPEHRAMLSEMQEKGELGCFGLTERFAGVNSGLVVQTTATWVPERQVFVLHSPTEGSYKNWISQGLVADWAAVIADLRVGGKSYGPHGFLMRFRDANTGSVAKGITLGDMMRKTTGNDLDNAWIRFDNVELPKSALLNRFAEIQQDKYVQTTAEKMRIEVIGQRLLTGRVAVAQAALQFARKLFDMTRTYSDAKKCWAPAGATTLSAIPHIQAVYQDGYARLDRLDAYMARVEAALSKVLRADGIPPAPLVEAIAVGKVGCVESAIEMCFRLKQEVGSYALMGDTGFEHMDFLQCCKFAEGDSRILMQKLARDRYRAFQAAMKKPSEQTKAVVSG